jgi:hypothetical protein
VKTLLLTVAGLALVTAPLAATAQSYGQGRDGGYSQHQDRRDQGRNGYDRGGYGRNDYGRDHRGDYRRDNDRSDRGDAALVSGMAGLLLGSALSGSNGYSQSYGYENPYYASAYSQRCDWQTQAYRGAYGRIEYRQVEICR